MSTGAETAALHLALLPSGCFLVNSDAYYPETAAEGATYGEGYQQPFIYNPMPTPGQVVNLREDPPIEPVSLDEVRRLSLDAPLVDLPSMDDYAAALVEGTLSLQWEAWSFILAPLRGAARPAQLLQALTGGRLPIEYLPFQDRSKTERRDAMQEELTRIIRARAGESRMLRFGVIDTAIGGFGVQDLAQMLAHASQAMPEIALQVDLLILHSEERRRADSVGRIEGVTMVNSDHLAINVVRVDVGELVVEDWDAALGVGLEFTNERFLVRWSSAPGEFYLWNGGEVRCVGTSNMPAAISHLMAAAVSTAVETDPRFKFVGEVWQEHVNR